MTLPAINAQLVLPVGRHTADWHDIEDVLVEGAPHADVRRPILAALKVWAASALDTFGPSRVWLNGGFITHSPVPPAGVTLVLVPDSPASAITALDDGSAYPLLTLYDVVFMRPGRGGHLPQLRSVGAMVDAYLADESKPNDLAIWDLIWSKTSLPDGGKMEGARKGYVEVRLL